MSELIRLKSRGIETNSLKRLGKSDGSTSRTWVLRMSYPFLKAGYTSDGRKFIEPSGGPVITEGGTLEDMTVRSIDFVAGYGWTVTFE